MTRTESLGLIKQKLELTDKTYGMLAEEAKKTNRPIVEAHYRARELLVELKALTENVLSEFVKPLTDEEIEERNHAVALLNAINSALNSHR